MRRAALSASLLVASVAGACAPAPADVRLASSTTTLAAVTSVVEGDLVYVTATPVDGSERMDLCVEGRSSSPSVLVQRVHGDCRAFVLSARPPGRATVRFEARGTPSELEIDVTRAP